LIGMSTALSKRAPEEGIDRIGPAHWTVRWQRHLYWVYAMLLIASGYVLTDAMLPTQVLSARVQEASEMTVNLSSRSRRHYRTRPTYTHWSLVKLDNGIAFQTENGASAFPIGGTMEVEVTALAKNVVRYKLPNYERFGWNEVEGANKEFLAFPVLVAGLALLLLAPWWSLENRWLMHGLMILVLVAWLLTLIGTGVMKAFG
jgi:hypothetical protein